MIKINCSQVYIFSLRGIMCVVWLSKCYKIKLRDKF